jgi:hypothetical protein
MRGDHLSVLLAVIVYSIVLYSLFFDRKVQKKSPEIYRRERVYRRAERAAARYATLPAVARETRRARIQSPAPVALPDFVQDVEAALVSLEYSKREARLAAKRASGDDFCTRLKNALAVVRTPARLTE